MEVFTEFKGSHSCLWRFSSCSGRPWEWREEPRRRTTNSTSPIPMVRLGLDPLPKRSLWNTFLNAFNFTQTLHYKKGRLCPLNIFNRLSPSALLDKVFSFAGIIAKDPTSLEEEIKEIRRSGSSKALDNTPEFELSDIFYFCRKGMETIMDDEVTKRFSAEELESWNLLSRTNYNFQYISLRLTVLWGLGVLIRYCFLLPLRWEHSLRDKGLELQLPEPDARSSYLCPCLVPILETRMIFFYGLVGVTLGRVHWWLSLDSLHVRQK